LDNLNKEWNKIGEAIKDRKKANKEDPCAELLAKKAENEAQKEEVKKDEVLIKAELDKMVNSIGNLVHESVPVSNDEENNKVERTWGTIPDIKITGKKGGYRHNEVLKAIDGYDPERGSKIARHRGYFLKGDGVMLNLALIQYGMAFLRKKGYTPIQPPYFMKRDVMAETCQLSDFDEQLYQVKAGKELDDEYYLIATSGKV
jgi:seryl-tRNA synthetase